MIGYTIAVVDDEPGIRVFLKEYLEQEGYAVVVASTSAELLDAIHARNIHAFMLDIELRDDSGLDLCRDLRAMPAFKQTPILCITGNDDAEYLVKAFSVGADDFITKPINLRSLGSRLKVQLQKRDLFLKLERARHMMQRYLSPRVALLADEYSVTGKIPPPLERQVAICFTDIRGFTARSELMDPVALFASLSGHLRTQIETVYRFGGYVDKFNGDGLMAVFDGEDMIEKCCLCALSIMEEAPHDHPGEKFPIGIGIHAGKVVIGNIGSPDHLDYSAVGPTVNLAARLCGYAQPENIVVSDAVRAAMEGSVLMEFLEPREVAIRGVSGLVKIFKLDRGKAPLP